MSRLSSKSDVALNPGITLCSLVLVCTIESINSSLVVSLGSEGDLSLRFLLMLMAWTAGELEGALHLLWGAGDGSRHPDNLGDASDLNTVLCLAALLEANRASGPTVMALADTGGFV